MSRPSRRELLRLGAAALAAPALAREARAAPPDAGSPASPTGPWPTTEKLLQDRKELLAQLARAPLANGDAPDLLPHPRITRGRR